MTYRTTYKIVFFSETPLPDTMETSKVLYEMSSGNIDYFVVDAETIPVPSLVAELESEAYGIDIHGVS